MVIIAASDGSFSVFMVENREGWNRMADFLVTLTFTFIIRGDQVGSNYPVNTG